MKKRLWSMLLVVAMCFTMLPTALATGDPSENPTVDLSTLTSTLTLQEADGEKQYSTDGGTTWTNYTGSITVTDGESKAASQTITVQSGTHDVVMNNATLTGNSFSSCAFYITDASVNLTLVGENQVDSSSQGYNAGIRVSSGASLTITEESTGSLTVTGGSQSAGIGGSNNEDNGTVTINGGTIIAKGGMGGAGIGGGNGGNGGTITINNGIITATGTYSGAGIDGGSGGRGGTITIGGGTITATGGNNGGAGIGGGSGSDGGTIAINGGKITATGGTNYSTGGATCGGAGIGGGYSGDGGTIAIRGGTIVATGGYNSAGIGGGGGEVSSASSGGDVTITGGNVNAIAGENAKNVIGAGCVGTEGTLGEEGTLTDGTDPVSLVTITIEGLTEDVQITESDVEDYGLTDVYTQDRKLYFYLPEGTTINKIIAGDTVYVSQGDNTFVQQVSVASVTIGEDTDYYATIEDAWAAAKGHADGATVTLLTDSSVSSGLTVEDSDNITLTSITKDDGSECSLTMGGNELTVNGGTFTLLGGDLTGSGSRLAVQGGTAKVQGGSLTGYNGVYTTGGILDITGGTISTTANYGHGINVGGGTITISGNAKIKAFQGENSGIISYALYVGSNITANVSITITGGTFYNAPNATQYSRFSIGTYTYVSNIAFSGGTFEGIESSGILTDLLAPGYLYYSTTSGKWLNNLGYKTSETVTVKKEPVSGIAINADRKQNLTYGYVEDEVPTLTADAELSEDVDKNDVLYQWYKDGEEIDGATSQTYTISTGLNAGDHKYTCTVTADGYSATSDAFTVTVEPADLSDASVTVNGAYIYTGSALEPTDVIVKLDEIELTADDYEITSYTNNTNAGTATVTVTGKGNYQGTATGTFAISPKTVTATVELEKDSFVYTGDEIKPAVTVKDGETVIPDTEYTVSYENNTDVGEATVTITDKDGGNYVVSGSATFTITQASLEAATITLDQDTFTYDGEVKTPAITVKMGDVTVDPGEYTVSYSNTNGGEGNHTNAGTVTMTVTAMDDGNYSGSNTTQFTISPADISEAQVNLATATTTYNGEEQTVNVDSVVLNGAALDAQTDYTLSGNIGTNVGTYTMTVTGTGNYTGAATATWTITPKSLTVDNWNITKVYDNSTDVKLDATDFALSGKCGDDDVELDVSEVTAHFDIVDVGNDKTIIYQGTFKLTGEDTSNYTLTQPDSLTGSITKRPITVTPDSKTMEYATDMPELTYIISGDGLVSGDSLTGALTCNIEDGNVGTYPITQGTLAASDNYDLTFVNDVTLTITQSDLFDAAVTPILPDGGYIYDGTAKTPNVTVTKNGKTVDSDAYTVTYSDNINAGTVTITVTAKENGNYTGSNDIATFTIQKANPDLGTVGYTGTIYPSTALEDIALTRTDETVDGALKLDDGQTLTMGEGTYNWTFTPTDTNNYNVVTGTVEITVTKDSLTGISVSGTPEKTEYVYGDTFDLNGLTVTAAYASGRTTDVTEYVTSAALSVGQTSVELTYIEDNVTKTCTVDGITVTKKALEVSGVAAVENLTYNGETQQGYTGIPTSDADIDDYTITYTGREGTEYNNTTAPINAGNYTVTIAIPDDNTNYSGSVSLDFTIEEKELTIQADDKTAYVNDILPELTYTVDGLVGDDNLITEPTLTCDADMSQIGEYTIAVSGAEAGSNYEITSYIEGTLTVTKRPSSGGVVIPTYPPTVTETDNGDVTVSPNSPKQGDTVTITPKPDDGYEVDKVTVTDSNGKQVEVKDNGDSTYSFTQPSGKVTITVTFKATGCPKDSTCPISKFTDASATEWYHDGVHYVLENGLMVGISDTEFAPNAILTRAELAQILYNKAGQPEVSSLSTFTDVPATAWYAKAIAWAQQNDVVSGIGNNQFAPNQTITRDQIAVMLYNEAGKPEVSGAITGFADAGNVSDWAYDAVLWATKNNVVNGAVQSDGTLLLNPTNGATRAETAALLKNFMEAK